MLHPLCRWQPCLLRPERLNTALQLPGKRPDLFIIPNDLRHRLTSLPALCFCSLAVIVV